MSDTDTPDDRPASETSATAPPQSAPQVPQQVPQQAPESTREPPPVSSDHGERLERIETVLGTVLDTLSNLAPGVKDESPVKVPWTHRGGRKR